jgi:hypothetical protein
MRYRVSRNARVQAILQQMRVSTDCVAKESSPIFNENIVLVELEPTVYGDGTAVKEVVVREDDQGVDKSLAKDSRSGLESGMYGPGIRVFEVPKGEVSGRGSEPDAATNVKGTDEILTSVGLVGREDLDVMDRAVTEGESVGKWVVKLLDSRDS